MTRLNFIDTTLRDAHQSLWSTRMTTAMMLPIAPVMDRIGFESIDLLGAVQMDVCVRYLGENPWERLRLMRKRVSRTPLVAGIRGQSLIGFGLVADDVVELMVRRLAANGIRQLRVFEGFNDIRNLEVGTRVANDAGLYVIGNVVYSISPVHTDEHFAQKAKELVRLGVKALMLKDPSGLLTPDRTRTLIPVLRKVAGEIPLVLHTHCSTGLAPLCHLEAIQLGVNTIFTAISPLANGPSHPATESMVRNVERMGYEVNLDRQGLLKMAEHFTRVARMHGKPLGRPVEYDPRHYEHQMPGGMAENFKTQLAQLGLENRYDEFLDEITRVREDLGWAIMVTPGSQLLSTQAVLNVLYGRYEVVPEEVEKLVLGYYGETPGPIKPEILDKVGKGKEPVTARPGELIPPAVDRIRSELGPFESDDDLLLAMFFRPDMLEKLHAAGPIREDRFSVRSPLTHLIREVANRRDIRRFHLVRQPGEGHHRGLRLRITNSPDGHQGQR